MSSSETIEKKYVPALTTIAIGAVSRATSAPATPGPPASAADIEVATFALPSTRLSRFLTSVGR